MATGDSVDILRRLKSLVPNGWFSDVAPIRDAVLGGLSDGLAGAYDLLRVVKAGTRRSSTTGWLLDLDAWGFLGPELLRRPGESDDAFRTRYIAEIFRDRTTRAAIIQALTELTGRTPDIVEPWNPGDCGGYNVSTLAYSGPVVTGGPVGAYNSGYAGWDTGQWGYSVGAGGRIGTGGGAGRWGTSLMPDQVLITAYRPPQVGTPNVGGYGTGLIGYNVGQSYWVGSDPNEITITDQEIYSVINRNKAAGIVAWTQIKNVQAGPSNAGISDSGFPILF